LDPVGSAVAFPKSIEFWKDRRIKKPPLFREIGLSVRIRDRTAVRLYE
jgi:hypothetical protein